MAKIEKPTDLFDEIIKIQKRIDKLERISSLSNTTPDIGNATVGHLFVDTNGALKYISPGGTTTTIAPA
jgi:hypothetical protein